MQKNRIDECFSTEGLISTLSEIEPSETSIDVNVEIEFKDAVVNVNGRILGYFHKQDLTDDVPQYSDLYDVAIEFSLITINYKTEYFEKRVRSLLLN